MWGETPVAVIEASECTSSYPTAGGTGGVFNRFLRETGGFQFDVAWWVGKWLGVPSFVVCIGDPDNKVHILSLANAYEVSVTNLEYVKFINDLGNGANPIEKALTMNPKTTRRYFEIF
jgi:hypothetical protein